jgi:hypothetical protein
MVLYTKNALVSFSSGRIQAAENELDEDVYGRKGSKRRNESHADWSRGETGEGSDGRKKTAGEIRDTLLSAAEVSTKQSPQ